MDISKVIVEGVMLLLLTGCSSSKKSSGNSNNVIIYSTSTAAVKTIQERVDYDPLQVKYSSLLGIPPEKIRNLKLYKFIDKWMNTPYKWGGDSEKGIDCSAFVQRLLSDVYTIPVPRTSVEQFLTQHVERFKSTDFLSEGDIVFFKTRGDKLISHVGFYLDNNMFLNSSSSLGVSIASLNNPYWKKCYVACGRLRQM